MRILKGSKISEINKDEFHKLIEKFHHLTIDLGTGDGRFVYQNALANPSNFYIGIDPAASHMEEYSKKSLKRKLTNALYVVVSIEHLDTDLNGLADELFINLPWGSLLSLLMSGDDNTYEKISNLIKIGGTLNIILGYSKESEPGETQRLGLGEINEEVIRDKIINGFKKVGLESTKLELLETANLKEFKTTWAKKLTFGKSRPLYFLSFCRSDLARDLISH